ncbi:sigma-G-dependent sporulation-specific acid-soluble spore protein CsgA [Anoxybacteroides tepidamans]|uniref:sigma-G-dependent sporulation-specific acid-soluble spore protein CsgA n=1 Tax=Anoxybacteroides tepidamans TaxID=265948 RepID=UPI00048785D4|nr:sigma-G-dependent sporulation-specific acid-soluble spore protein CsgA [Anoxybacillus tepidamans]
METTLAYLRETLSNYLDYHSDIPRRIYKKLLEQSYANEEEFVQHLSQQEIAFLDRILPHEIRYAMNEQDQKRARQLNEVYELLF